MRLEKARIVERSRRELDQLRAAPIRPRNRYSSPVEQFGGFDAIARSNHPDTGQSDKKSTGPYSEWVLTMPPRPPLRNLAIVCDFLERGRKCSHCDEVGYWGLDGRIVNHCLGCFSLFDGESPVKSDPSENYWLEDHFDLWKEWGWLDERI